MKKSEPSCCYKSRRRNQNMGSFHRNEEDDESLTEMESESPLQNFIGLEAGNTTVIAQAAVEHRQGFCPSNEKHWQLQPQRVAPSRRASPKTLTEGARRQKEYSECRRPFVRTRSRKNSLRMTEKRQVVLETPCSSVASLSFQSAEVSCCADIYTSAGGSPELNSHPESVYIYAESIKGSISCSSVSQDWDSLLSYTEVQKSCAVVRDPGSKTAEMSSSIEALFGSDSSCGGESTRADSDSDSSCVYADWEQSFDSDSDLCNSFAKAQWGSASSCSGSAASGYITDYDLESSFSTTEQHDSSASCSHFEAGYSDSEIGQVETKHYDLAVNHFDVKYHDLPASHYKPGQNLPVGYFETGHWDFPLGHFESRKCDPLVGHFEPGHNLPAGHFELGLRVSLDGHFVAGHHNFPVGHFEAGHRDSPAGHFEAGHRDTPVGHFEAGHHDSPAGHFEAGHRDSPAGHFEAGHRDSPAGHFEAGHRDSPAGHFEAGHRDSPAGHFEAGHCDTPVGHFEAGHRDSPAGHFEAGHRDTPVGHFEAGHRDTPVGHFEAGHRDSPVGHFEAGHRDTPVGHFEAGHRDSPVGHFEAGHRDSPAGHFEAGHRETPVGHFEAGHRDSLAGHFEAGHRDSLAGHFEAGHCDSLAGHFEAGNCKSPVGHFYAKGCDQLVGHFEAVHNDSSFGQFNADTYDLYNAVPESTAVWCSDQKQNNFCPLFDYPELTWRKLCGVVTHPDRYRVAPFFHEMMKETEQDRNQEEVKINKGFLFHPQRFLQAKNSEYREGREYSMLRHVQNGSYGDVFSVRDKQTGFTCAAKRIPLSSFSWEEVGTWSRLDSSRVLQLYGAVREGLNVVLFMDLKTGSLAQLLKAKGHFPEAMALYYHRQVLQALEHLHSRKVIHLDVKVDNVLLSQDKKECFLCDFGLSEMLDQTGYSTKTFRGNGLRGTESHMSPEVARGDPRSDKADVWSSCCMLLHMLSGHQPWTRYYTHPLCLKIVSEPEPLWEIPPECDLLTRDVISGGLVKEPRKRDSARKLLEKSSRALQAVGSLFDPVQSATCKPLLQFSPLIPSHSFLPKQPTVSSSAIPNQKELSASKIQWISGWRDRAAEDDGTEFEDTYEDSDRGTDETGSWMYWGLRNESTISGEEEGQSDEEVESHLGSLRGLGSEGEWEPFRRLQILCGSKWQHSEDEWSETEEFAASMISLNWHEPNSRLTLACHRSVCASDAEHTDKGSDLPDDLSSGVFSSYSSIPDERSFNVDWSVSTNQPPSCSFEGLGVDIWVEDVNGDTFRIRERLKVKLGHVAVGISAQISMRAFSLATLDGKLVSPDTEVLESRMWLLCLPAPDNSTCWTWRIRDGKLETQEADGVQSDTCSTLAL